MKKTLKIGRNRNKARIWIEGQVLATMGWNKGVTYIKDFSNGIIRYEKVLAGTPRCCKVAGTDTRPIIDTNSDRILDTLGHDATHVEIHVSEGNIVITKADAPSGGLVKKAAMVTAFALSLAAPFISQFKHGHKRVLVACEESATVRDEFLALGHDAVSCDILDTRNPYGPHITGDVRPYLDRDWDIVVGFGPCDFLTISAAWAFNDPDYERYPEVGYHQRVGPDTLTGAARRAARVEAVEFIKLMAAAGERSGMENPKGFLSKMWRKPDQIIQPYEFGDPHSKATCLWLRNLPPLELTNVLDIKEHGWLADNGTWRWHNQTASGQNNLPPSKDRKKLRSTTYPGIAKAMATQWSILS